MADEEQDRRIADVVAEALHRHLSEQLARVERTPRGFEVSENWSVDRV